MRALLFRLFLVLWALTLTGAAFYLAGNISLERLYSLNPVYRMQTEAMLEGSLAIVKDLSLAQHDWAIGEHGVYQMWGLGVPFLRLPFEALARAMGCQAFPDILLLGLVYFLAALSVTSGLMQLLEVQGSTRRKLAALAIAGYLFVSPQMVMLLRHTFGAYEEAIFYLACWNLIGLGLFLSWLKRRSARSLSVAIAFIAGLAVLFRPTGVLVGGSFVSVLCLDALRQRRTGHAFILGTVFSLGPLLCCLLNYLRFGHPLEFGYALQLDQIDYVVFSQVFDYPFQRAGIVRGFLELVGAMFFLPHLNDFDSFREHLFPGQVNLLRYREFYLEVFSAVHFCIFGAAACLAVASISMKKLRAVLPAELCLWFIVSGAALALFYSTTPALVSRYFYDFFPTYAAAFVLFVLACRTLLESSRVSSITLAGGLAALLFWNVDQFGKQARSARATTDVEGRGANYPDTQSWVLQLFPAGAEPAAPLPAASYECPEWRESPQRVLYLNKMGWTAVYCFVNYVTSLYLPSSEKIVLEVEDDENLHAEDIRVRSNIDEYALIKAETEGERRRLTFQRKPAFFESKAVTRRVTIGWAKADEIEGYVPQFRLLYVEALDPEPVANYR